MCPSMYKNPLSAKVRLNSVLQAARYDTHSIGSSDHKRYTFIENGIHTAHLFETDTYTNKCVGMPLTDFTLSGGGVAVHHCL